MKSIQMFVVKNKELIKRLFHWLWYALVASIAFGIVFSLRSPDKIFLLYEPGKKLGAAALSFYLVGLLPGILKRTKWLTPIQVSLMLFRRHFGVTMFLAGIGHSLYTTLLRVLIVGAPLVQQIEYTFGLLALLVTFPLWLTSNDTSQKYLGKKWKWLHRLTYLILLLLFGHVALQQKRWAYLVGFVLLLELYSWIRVWLRPNAATQATSVQSKSTASPQQAAQPKSSSKSNAQSSASATANSQSAPSSTQTTQKEVSHGGT